MFENLSTIQNLFSDGHVNWPAFFAAAAWAGGALATMAAARYHTQVKNLGADLDEAEKEIEALRRELGVADNRVREQHERVTHLLQVIDECHRDYDTLAACRAPA